MQLHIGGKVIPFTNRGGEWRAWLIACDRQKNDVIGSTDSIR